jgi:hypothetical protein
VNNTILMSNNEGRNSETFIDEITRRSSWFFLNSAAVLEESHARLYSSAISVKTLSFTSPDGAITESFSIIWNNNIETDILVSVSNYSIVNTPVKSIVVGVLHWETATKDNSLCG